MAKKKPSQKRRASKKSTSQTAKRKIPTEGPSFIPPPEPLVDVRQPPQGSLGFLEFAFLTDAEKSELRWLQSARLSQFAAKVKRLEHAEVNGVRFVELTDKDRAEEICLLLCENVTECNREGQKALMRVLESRGRGLAVEDRKQAVEQLAQWRDEQIDWAISLYDDYSDTRFLTDASIYHPENQLRIEQAVKDSIHEAICELNAIASRAVTATPRPTPQLRIEDEAHLAFWGEERLTINSHADFRLLQRLQPGEVVNHLDALRAIKPEENVPDSIESSSQAPQEVKDAVTHIRAALKQAKCPLRIENVRSVGFRLTPA